MTDKYDLKLRDSFEGETISFLEALEMARVHERKQGNKKTWNKRLPKCPDCNGKMVIVCEEVYKNGINALAHSGCSQEEMTKSFGWKARK